MTRENAHDKGRRYLTEGRLTVTSVTNAGARAVCKGDSGDVYTLGRRPGRGWTCTCPARTPRCAHLVALRLVILIAPDRTESA